MSTHTDLSSRVTFGTPSAMKQAGEEFTMLTAYDASFAAVLDEARVDVLRVGDSLGMVVQGHETARAETMYRTRL